MTNILAFGRPLEYGNGNPVQYFCRVDRSQERLQSLSCKSWTWVSDFECTHTQHEYAYNYRIVNFILKNLISFMWFNYVSKWRNVCHVITRNTLCTLNEINDILFNFLKVKTKTHVHWRNNLKSSKLSFVLKCLIFSHQVHFSSKLNYVS